MTTEAKSRLVREAWGSMEWLVDGDLQPGARLSLARMRVEAGQCSALHRHPECDEAVHVVAGSIEQRIGERLLRLGPGESAHIPAGLAHCSRALGSEAAILLVAYSAGHRIYEAC